MTGSVVLQLVLAVLGGGVVSSLVQAWQARRKLPIERDTAHAAASREIVEAATELLDPMRAELAELREESRAAREEARIARREADAAREEARAAQRSADRLLTIVREAEEYIADLHARWDEHRRQSRPPWWRWMDGLSGN